MAADVEAQPDIRELEAQLQEIMQQNELLLKENEMFMTFLQRNGVLDEEEEVQSPQQKKKCTTHTVARWLQKSKLSQLHLLSISISPLQFSRQRQAPKPDLGAATRLGRQGD
jgi:hypothetical protein